MALAHDAGLGKLSLTSVIAGMLCAFGCFAVLAAIAGGILAAMGVDSTRDLSGDWRDVGIGTGAVLAAVLFLSYLFGGYVAGRMARRAGLVNGLLVFGLSLLVAAGVGAAVGMQADTDMVIDNLRSIGIPTSGDEWTAIGTIGGLAALAAMLLGSLAGGALGERWHGKLLTRAMDPGYGDIDIRDRSLDDERATTRDRTVVASGGRPSGDHFARDGERRDVGHDHDRDHDADDWDGETTTRRISDTSTTLDDDLQQKH